MHQFIKWRHMTRINSKLAYTKAHQRCPFELVKPRRRADVGAFLAVAAPPPRLLHARRMRLCLWHHRYEGLAGSVVVY